MRHVTSSLRTASGLELFRRGWVPEEDPAEGYYHEIFNEIGRGVVYADLLDWLGEHTAQTPAAR